MSNLLDLMRRLGSDAELALAYHDNPSQVIRAAGLDARERQAVVDKDTRAIGRLIGIDAPPFATIMPIKLFDARANDLLGGRSSG